MNPKGHLYLDPKFDDLKEGTKIPGLGVIEEATDKQVKIESVWYDKRTIVPIERLSASRIKRILQTLPEDLKAEDIRYLRQVENDIYKPNRSEELDKIVRRLTGKNLFDDPYLAHNLLYKIESFYQLRGQKPSRNLINRSRDSDLEEELEL